MTWDVKTPTLSTNNESASPKDNVSQALPRHIALQGHHYSTPDKTQYDIILLYYHTHIIICVSAHIEMRYVLYGVGICIKHYPERNYSCQLSLAKLLAVSLVPCGLSAYRPASVLYCTALYWTGLYWLVSSLLPGPECHCRGGIPFPINVFLIFRSIGYFFS